MTSSVKVTAIQEATAPSEIATSNPIIPLTQRSMFWRPAYLEQSAWLEHIPFAFWLVEAHRPRVIVELGAHYGVSYFAFCQAVDRLGLDTRCFAVDTWKGDEHAGLYDERVFEQVKTHNDAQYSGFSRLVRSTFDDAVKHFEDGSIDLLHIDGLHTFEAVLHDFETWRPKLSGRGIVLMHDINVRERGFGVFKLFDKLKEQFPHFEFAHCHGLGVLGVGTEQEELVQRLFQASISEHTRQTVHEVFGRLGRACTDALTATKQQERAKALSGEVEKQKKQLDEFKQSLEKTKTDLNSRAKELNDTRARLQNQIEQHAVERGHLAERVSLLQELRTELKEEVARLHARIEATSGELTEKSAQLAALTRQTAEHQQWIGEAKERIDARDRNVAELTEKLHAREEELNRARAASAAEIERLKSSLKMQTDALSDATSAAEAVGAQVSHLNTEIAERDEALSALQASSRLELENLQKRIAQLAAEVARLGDERSLFKQTADESGARIEGIELSRQKLEKDNQTLRIENAAQAKHLQDRFTELATLTKMLEEREAGFQTKAKEALTYQRLTTKLEDDLKISTAALMEAEMRLSVGSSSSDLAKDATLAKVESDNEKLKDELAAKVKAATALQQRAAKLEGENENLKIDRKMLSEKLADRFKEIATLTNMLEERDYALTVKEKELDSEKRRVARLKGSLSWKVTAPVRALVRPFAKPKKESDRTKAKIALIAESGLFDESWYLAQYPDVTKNGANPIEHYLRYGASEGRNPGPNFDTKWYLATYRDVAKTGTNPLVHFIQYGKKEGRVACHYDSGK